MDIRSPLRLSPVAVLAIVFLLSSSLINGCKCSEDKKRSRSNEAAEVSPTPTPTPTDQTAEEISNAGVEIDPIETDKIVALDTNDGAQLYKIPFKTSSSIAVGRQLTEYLLIIRANEKSCLRLKTRPTSGLGDFVEVGSVNSQTTGYEACSGDEVPVEEPEAAELHLVDSAPKLEYGKVHANPTFGLVEPTLCSSRIFRMAYGGNVGYGASEGLNSVSTKTARLAHIGSKVRVWIDEEYSSFCDASGSLDTEPSVAFGALFTEGLLGNLHKDMLWKAQVQNLAASIDTIIESMTNTFGPVSDIDASGKIEIFLSPDVNRKYFIKQYNTKPDSFRSTLVYRPEDLAYYNASTNPLSNEGEVLYLWAPDPGGLYNYSLYPSANSLSSNYAKGYLAAQVMTLIIANQRLLVNDTEMEEQWLTNALSYLASAYYAGNDFTVQSLAQYLTSRPQNLSLTEGVDAELVSDRYKSMAWDEHAGLVAMFGWYLHTRKCAIGNNVVTPCAALKSLIQTANSGRANLEAVFETTFGKLLEGFGATVGSALADDPAVVRALWAAEGSADVEGPIGLPALSEVLPGASSSSPTTVENTVAGNVDSGSAADRTVAGPFPTIDSLIYQPILPDNDMDFKLAKDSVTYVLFTGMVEEETIITAFLGKGLNVSFVPVGDRDPSIRQVYTEKKSEGAHMDLRPVNFTGTEDEHTTYYSPRAYPSYDYSINEEKDFWILGSIDNFTVNQVGEQEPVGDSDSYNIEVEPCKHLSEPAKTDCVSNTDHIVTVQLHIREFAKELSPMLLVSSPEIGIYRGHSLYGRVKEIDPSFIGYEDENKFGVICQSQSSWATPVSLTAADDGAGVETFTVASDAPVDANTIQFLPTAELPANVEAGKTYNVINAVGLTFKIDDPDTGSAAVDFTLAVGAITAVQFVNTTDASPDKCANANLEDALVFNHENTINDPTSYLHTYDNFLFSGLSRFPFFNTNGIFYLDHPERKEIRSFLPVEKERQFFTFNYTEELDASIYEMFSVPRGRGFIDDGYILEDETVAILVSIKGVIDSGAGTNPQSDAFVENCTSITGTTDILCESAGGSTDLEDAVKSQLIQDDAKIVCDGPLESCQGKYLLMPGPITSGDWIKPTLFYYYQETGVEYETYYKAIEPESRDSYCGGDPAAVPTTPQTCELMQESISPFSDIREQLNIPRNNFRKNGVCNGALDIGEYRVCADSYSYKNVMEPDWEYSFSFMPTLRATDRNNGRECSEEDAGDLRYMPISVRAGEVLSKPERIHTVRFGIPAGGDGGTGITRFHTLVGGLDKSQGKYLLRVRVRSTANMCL